MENLKVNIEKSPIPMIWLDASVLLNITKTQLGEITNALDIERCQYLNGSIEEKIKERKLICPSADQFEEIEIGGRLEMEFQRVQRSLSFGIKINHRQGIEEFLIGTFMKAYADSKSGIHLNYKDVFNEDPIKKLESTLKCPFIVNIYNQKPKELLEKEKAIKKALPERWEELRREKVAAGVTFEEEREKEIESYLGTLLALSNKSIESNRKGNLDIYDLANATNLSYYLCCWNYCGGQPPGLEGLSKFFSSEYFKQIPIIEIACSIRAKIATQRDSIKPGDYMDIEQISAVLPFFDIVITDASMRHCLNLLKYPDKYKCKIFSISEFDKIKSLLNSL
jgi:hypothetical protein